MSFYRPTSQGVDLQKESEVSKPKRSVGGIAFAIIAIAVIVAIVVVVIIWMVVRNRSKTTTSTSTNGSSSSSTTTTCTTVLQAPGNVLAVYNQNNNTAALSWQGVTGATRYRVYRKLEDPGVNTNNYDQRVDSINNSYNFLDLPAGTHYFVVTSFSSCGLESPISSPAVFSPSCATALAPLDPAGVTVNTIDGCGALAPAFGVEIDVPFGTAYAGGIIVFNGNGQEGSVKSHLSFSDVNASDPLATTRVQVVLECGSLNSEHFLSYITDVQNVPLSPVTTQLALTTTTASFPVNWSPIAGAEMYLVSMGTESPAGIIHYYGGYTTAPQTTITLATQPGDAIFEIRVRAFRVCNRSPLSAPIPVTTSALP